MKTWEQGRLHKHIDTQKPQKRETDTNSWERERKRERSSDQTPGGSRFSSKNIWTEALTAKGESDASRMDRGLVAASTSETGVNITRQSSEKLRGNNDFKCGFKALKGNKQGGYFRGRGMWLVGCEAGWFLINSGARHMPYYCVLLQCLVQTFWIRSKFYKKGSFMLSHEIKCLIFLSFYWVRVRITVIIRWTCMHKYRYSNSEIHIRCTLSHQIHAVEEKWVMSVLGVL